MTQLCYTLEEAAEKLNISETVLVRLSQYFKVPSTAYEEVGYLSFKGDLVFTEPDLAFFRRVKEALVAGESLEQVKQKLPALVQQTSTNTPSIKPNGLSSHEIGASRPESLGGLREIQDPAPYQKAAEKSFERYKSTHRTGLSRVFENMIKDVSATPKTNSAPDYKPMRHKVGQMNHSREDSQERLLPFHRGKKPLNIDSEETVIPSSTEPRTVAQEPISGITAASEASWNRLIQDAVQHPRALNQQLKTVAILLREQAMAGHTRSDITRNP